jgi:hypothetical protein
MRSVAARNLILCAAVVLAAGCSGGGAKSSGPASPVAATSTSNVPKARFNDPTFLAADIQRQGNQRLADPKDPNYTPGVTFTQVSCVRSDGPHFECVGVLSNGARSSVEATVAADGLSYVTSSAS